MESVIRFLAEPTHLLGVITGVLLITVAMQSMAIARLQAKLRQVKTNFYQKICVIIIMSPELLMANRINH